MINEHAQSCKQSNVVNFSHLINVDILICESCFLVLSRTIAMCKYEQEKMFDLKYNRYARCRHDELHMITIYKRSSSSLHDFDSMKLELLKISLKEEQFNRSTQ